MHSAALIAVAALAAAPFSLAQDNLRPISVTQTNELNTTTRTGQFSWTLAELDFGYAAGTAISFGGGIVSGGYRAEIMGVDNGLMIGNWLVNATHQVVGLIGVFNNINVKIDVIGNKNSGEVELLINGKETTIPVAIP